MADAPTHWTSQSQRIVALSSTEAEYIALSETAKQALYIRQLLSELLPDKLQPTPIYNDNQSALTLAISPSTAHHTRTKHIDTRYRFVNNCIENYQLSVHYQRTEDMVADILTKPLPTPRFELLRPLLGIRPPPTNG